MGHTSRHEEEMMALVTGEDADEGRIRELLAGCDGCLSYGYSLLKTMPAVADGLGASRAPGVLAMEDRLTRLERRLGEAVEARAATDSIPMAAESGAEGWVSRFLDFVSGWRLAWALVPACVVAAVLGGLFAWLGGRDDAGTGPPAMDAQAFTEIRSSAGGRLASGTLARIGAIPLGFEGAGMPPPRWCGQALGVAGDLMAWGMMDANGKAVDASVLETAPLVVSGLRACWNKLGNGAGLAAVLGAGCKGLAEDGHAVAECEAGREIQHSFRLVELVKTFVSRFGTRATR